MKNGKKAMKTDRISDLPRPILHHILSHLSQIDAVKTCVLSKSWRCLWYGRPNFEFCKDDFKGLTVQKFISVLHKTLIRYENQNLSIQQFILKIPETTNDSRCAPLLKKWIPKIVMRNIKCIETFQLCFHITEKYIKGIEYFELSSIIYLSEYLREIHLEGCKLNQVNSIDKVLFGHLQKLRLCHVKVEDETFERIMSSCPLIEEVALNYCEGLNTIKLNNHICSLKNFEFRQIYFKKSRIEIADVSHIETIKIKGCSKWLKHHFNNLFTHLKSLHLRGVNLTTQSVQSFSCNFPCLEELDLSICDGKFKEFQLSSHSIKRLSIKTDYDPIKVTIDAPNILEFEYEGDFAPQISFTTTSKEWKSKIVLTTELDDAEMDISEWLQKLDELLKVLCRSETSLHILVSRDLDQHRRFLGDVHYQIEAILKYLKLCLGSLCSDYSVLFELDGETRGEWNS